MKQNSTTAYWWIYELLFLTSHSALVGAESIVVSSRDGAAAVRHASVCCSLLPWDHHYRPFQTNSARVQVHFTKHGKVKLCEHLTLLQLLHYDIKFTYMISVALVSFVKSLLNQNNLVLSSTLLQALLVCGPALTGNCGSAGVERIVFFSRVIHLPGNRPNRTY